MQYPSTSFKKIILILVVIISIVIFIYTSSIRRSRKSDEIKEFQIEFKDFNISYFHFGFDEPACDNRSNVLIATLSTPNSSYLRMGIRDSWKKDIPSIFTHKFFIGLTLNETLQKMNEEEAYEYGDIVFTNLIDSNANITLKMVSVFQWQQYFCPKVDFVLRADEDNVLDVPRFQHWLNLKFNMFKKSYNDSLIFGHVFENKPVIRNPTEKWYVPYEAYKLSYYPPYEYGASYLITPHSIKLILNDTKNHFHIPVDDAFLTGIIADKLKITRINATRHFAYGNPLNPLNSAAKWDRECDDNGVPFLFSLSNENGEIEQMPGGYEMILKRLKELKCSSFET